VIGHFRLGRDPLSATEYHDLPPSEASVFENNAHRKRDPFDAEVLLYGDSGSALYEVAVPLSGRGAGTDPNRLVTECSRDSGKGPWWRRPLRFDRAGTEELLAIHRTGDRDRPFG
jgi:hypothetical protein